MAQLYYRYGTMNSGKTIEILKVAYNYEEQGKGVVIMTSALDTRDGVGYVSSRIGMKRPALAIEETTDIFGYIRDLPCLRPSSCCGRARHTCHGFWFEK